MNYVQSREQSAEILRNVIAQIARHDAAYNPLSFALWYEHVAGINWRLSQAMDTLLNAGTRLDDAQVVQLFREFVAPADEQELERISSDFQRSMLGMAESAARTGDEAGRFGEQLHGFAQALKSGEVVGLSPQVDRALDSTVGMRNSAQALQQQVQASRAEIEKLQVELSRARQEALLDPLTRVLNRRGFQQKLAGMLEQTEVDDQPDCLIMLDIDHFKQVNDTHGHVTGDRVIQALGEVLRAAVQDHAFAVARYGGEEFAVLLPRTPLVRAKGLAESLLERTKAMKIRNRKTQEVLLTVTLSAGVAARRPSDDASQWVARADAALYQSKQAGRDRVTCA